MINKRSIRDIPIPQNGGVNKNGNDASSTSESGSKDNIYPKSRVDEILEDKLPTPLRRDKSKYVLWSIVFVSIVALVFAISSLFSGATVNITPKQQRITLSDTLTASMNAPAADVSYQIVQISDTASKAVNSDSEEFVEETASGQIVIFNNHSSASQKLIDKTRFQTPEGKIYRIRGAVTVPGQNTVDGKVVPGQLEVTVYADEPSSDYNVGLTDFVIPGFEGDPRFDSFFARSKTPISGGFSGTKPVINEDAEAQAQIELQELLKERLSNELGNRISSSLILPEGGVFYAFEPLSTTKNENGGVEITHKGTLFAVAINATDLASAILQKTGEGSSSPVQINNLNELQIILLNSEEFDIQSGVEASIGVSGDARLVWVFDEEQIKEDLSGEKKKDLSNKLSSYEAIEKARAVLRPFWKRTFPTDISRIKVKIELD